MRRYDIPVLVRTADPDAGPPGFGGLSEGPLPPAQFLWHDRLYVVREVLAQWRERTAWWSGAAGRGVHGETDAGPAAGPAGSAESAESAGLASTGGASGEPGRRGSASAVQERWDAADRWVWRVEASAGRSGAAGTFDLSREGPPERGDGSAAAGGDGAREPTWRLVRVCD